MSDAAPPLRIGWFSSGLGQGSRALLRATLAAIDAGDLNAVIPVLFLNNEPGENENADGLRAIAAEAGIPNVGISDRRFRRRVGGEIARAGQPLPPWRADYDRAVMELLVPFEFDVGMLAGYMLIFAPEFCARYPMLNLHPAKPGGPIGTWQRVIWQLIDERATESGVLIHRVIPEVDEGPVVAYCRYPLRGPTFDPLWQALEDQSAEQIRAAEGEAHPLFQAIRAEGLKRETVLVLQTLRALADRRIAFVDGRPVTADGPLSGGLDLTPEVEAAVARPR